MKNFNKLLRFAKQLELKYLTAQDGEVVATGQTAQAADIQDALYKARLGPVQRNGSIDTAVQNDLINKVSPLLDALGIPGSTAINIDINVSAGPSVSFSPTLTPDNPEKAKQLSLKLLQNFSKPLAAALKNANISVTGTVTASWLGIK